MGFILTRFGDLAPWYDVKGTAKHIEDLNVWTLAMNGLGLRRLSHAMMVKSLSWREEYYISLS